LSVIVFSASIKALKLKWDISFEFGNLAILIPEEGMVDPMALRPRLSTGLPLSDEQMIRFKQNEPDGYQAREGFRSSHLRQPGNPDPSEGDGRPNGFASPSFDGFAIFGICLIAL